MTQAQFSFLLDEAKISDNLKISINHPVRVFRLQDLGINEKTFIDDTKPTFNSLPWDRYDWKRERVEFLISHFPDKKERLIDFLVRWYAKVAQFGEIQPLFKQLSIEERLTFFNTIPDHRRASSQFVLTRCLSCRWDTSQTLSDGLPQVLGDGQLCVRRKFREMSRAVTEHPEFRKLLIAVGDLVKGARSGAKELSISVYQMGIVARCGEPATNSREGIHQDGADYIIPAIVVERTNIVGGQSIVFGPDKTTRYLERELQPGEGIFQADDNSPLWHCVSPIEVDPRAPSTCPSFGVRNIFGFDIWVQE